MFRALHVIVFLISSLAIGAVAAQPIEVRIGVSDSLAPRIIRTWKNTPQACDQDDLFSDKWLRTTLEFFILCRAIRLGGVDAVYRFENFPNSARTRAELKRGEVMIMVDFPWGDFADDDELYESIAVLPEGSFVKAVYTLPGNTELLNVKTLAELRRFTGVSSRHWRHDWAALKHMKVRMIDVSRYDQMGAMVARGAADFLVGEFPGVADLSQYINGVRFVPVPGVKIVLPGSRHVAVSKRVPHAKQVFEAIQVGLKRLRDRGLIEKGYRISGFFNSRVESWKDLCCE